MKYTKVRSGLYTSENGLYIVKVAGVAGGSKMYPNAYRATSSWVVENRAEDGIHAGDLHEVFGSFAQAKEFVESL